jgi:hypothetical protein
LSSNPLLGKLNQNNGYRERGEGRGMVRRRSISEPCAKKFKFAQRVF